MKRNVFYLALVVIIIHLSCNVFEECDKNAYEGMILFNKNCSSCHKLQTHSSSEISTLRTLKTVKNQELNAILFNAPKNKGHKAIWNVVSDCDKKHISEYLSKE